MNGRLLERAQEMLVHPERVTMEATARQLHCWIAVQVDAVRSLGARNRVRARLSIIRDTHGERVECGFSNQQGATYAVVIVATGCTDLMDSPAQVADATAALTVLGALLAELGMQAALA